MTEHPDASTPDDDPRVVIVGPNGMAMSGNEQDADGEDRQVTDLVEQPAKVMRIGSMIRQLLEEVKSAPLDEASRARLAGTAVPKHIAVLKKYDGLTWERGLRIPWRRGHGPAPSGQCVPNCRSPASPRPGTM